MSQSPRRLSISRIRKFEYDLTAPPTPQPSPPQTLLQPPPLKASTSERSLRVKNELQDHLQQILTKLEMYKGELSIATTQHEEHANNCIIEKKKTAELRQRVSELSAGLESKQAQLEEIRRMTSDAEDRVRSLRERVTHLRSGQVDSDEREVYIIKETERFQEMKQMTENRMVAADSSLERLQRRHEIEKSQLMQELNRLKAVCQHKRLAAQFSMNESENLVFSMLEEQDFARQGVAEAFHQLADKDHQIHDMALKQIHNLRQNIAVWDTADTHVGQHVRECQRNMQGLSNRIRIYQQV
jgi:chromosome segregation ATPase